MVKDAHSIISDLFSKVVIGDKFFREALIQTERNYQYPPYNLFKVDESHYKIEIAVAGFNLNELCLEQKEDKLTITGKKEDKDSNQYLWKGISKRNFSLTFVITDYIKIEDVTLDNGMLIISLKEEIPQSKLPRLIPINQRKTDSQSQLEVFNEEKV